MTCWGDPEANAGAEIFVGDGGDAPVSPTVEGGKLKKAGSGRASSSRATGEIQCSISLDDI